MATIVEFAEQTARQAGLNLSRRYVFESGPSHQLSSIDFMWISSVVYAAAGTIQDTSIFKHFHYNFGVAYIDRFYRLITLKHKKFGNLIRVIPCIFTRYQSTHRQMHN